MYGQLEAFYELVIDFPPHNFPVFYLREKAEYLEIPGIRPLLSSNLRADFRLLQKVNTIFPSEYTIA